MANRFWSGFGAGFIVGAVFVGRACSSSHEADAAAIDPAVVALRQRAFDDAKRDLNEDLFGHFVQHARVILGEPDPRKRPDGTYNVLVPISWHIDPKPIIYVLNEKFDDGELQENIVDYDYEQRSELRPKRVDFTGRNAPDALGMIVYRASNSGDRQRRSYTERLYQWLTKQQLQIVVKLASRSGKLTVSSGRRCDERCRDHGDHQYQLHLEHDAGDKALIFAAYGEQEPILISSVPASAVERLDGKLDIKVEVERVEIGAQAVAPVTTRSQ